jgi:TIR domain
MSGVWLTTGMPMQTIRIYGRSAEKLSAAQKIFAVQKAVLAQSQSSAQSEPQWDAFISYAREDGDAALRIAASLKQSGLNVFVDQLDLAHGSA